VPVTVTMAVKCTVNVGLYMYCLSSTYLLTYFVTSELREVFRVFIWCIVLSVCASEGWYDRSQRRMDLAAQWTDSTTNDSATRWEYSI